MDIKEFEKIRCRLSMRMKRKGKCIKLKDYKESAIFHYIKELEKLENLKRFILTDIKQEKTQ